MRRLTVLLSICLLCVGCTSSDRLPSDRSPHAEALALVFEKCRERIGELERQFANEPPDSPEERRWWFDALDRTWHVRRPAEPGVFDTTHDFFISYEIDGKEVASWSVNTRDQSVEENGPPATQSSD